MCGAAAKPGFSPSMRNFKLAGVVRPELDRPIALVTIANGADHTKPTVFGRSAFESLARVLGRLESEDWAALVFTGKPYFFSAGADLDEFTRRADADLAREGSRTGHELFGRIRALPYPTVAAINGACLGGGVELALHCDARTISNAVRHFACPECLLGIVPGWGGTQLVPRLVGAETAIEFVVENPLNRNRMLDGRRAHELGFADRLLEPAELVDESLAFAVELARKNAPQTQHEDSPLDTDVADTLQRARARLDDAVHGAAPAPYRALDLIEGALSGWSLEQGYEAEEDAIAELLPGPQAQASLYAFDLVERRAKRPPKLAAEPRPLARVGIVGAGLMATQLAALFLRRLELPLVLADVDEQALEHARAAIEAELAGLVAKGRYDQGKARFLGSLVRTTTGRDEFAGCQLVLEAVYEELAVKQQVFAELEALVSPETVLATNTSALSVTEMAAGLAHPERVAGMHFFNPVALLPLVEIVRGERTDDATVATALDIAARLRKRPVLVRDAPGFGVNRILTRLLSTVLTALERCHSLEAPVDAALILGAGFPFWLGGITKHLESTGISARMPT